MKGNHDGVPVCVYVCVYEHRVFISMCKESYVPYIYKGTSKGKTNDNHSVERDLQSVRRIK